MLALANPGGRGLRTTFGLVSATGRGFRGPRGRRVAGSIEHTAPLPRGSSGGPLVDAEGSLLGLNAVRRDGGFILALPADAALRRRVDELGARRGGRAGRGSASRSRRRAWRAGCAPPSGCPSATACSCAASTTAARPRAPALERGDLLVRAGDRPLASMDDLFDALDDAGDSSRSAWCAAREERERRGRR